MQYPTTPDGRYLVVRGRLWRMANPDLPEVERSTHVSALMQARRAVGAAKKAVDAKAALRAHKAVDAAKQALGERGPVWWTDGKPDLTRHMARTTEYAEWFAKIKATDVPS